MPTIRVSSFDITEIAFEKLNDFKIVAYTVPETYIRDTNKVKYGTFQNICKEIGKPFYFFTNEKPLPCVYVLYKQTDKTIKDIEYQGTKLNYNVFSIDEKISSHVLMKLMLAHYFASREDFVCNSRFLKFANGNKATKNDRKKDKEVITCLEIKINQFSNSNTTFKVTDNALRLIETTLENEAIRKYDATKSEPFFDKLIKSEAKGYPTYFRELKKSEVEKKEQTVIIYRIARKEEDRLNDNASLDNLSTKSIEAFENSRTYLLHDFLCNFELHLAKYGIKIAFHTKIFDKVSSTKNAFPNLPLSGQNICVYDLRKNKETVSLEQYVETLNHFFDGENKSKKEAKMPNPNITFLPLIDIAKNEDFPVLILQDYEKEDTEKAAILSEEIDEYMLFKADLAYKQIPTQFLNVNYNPKTTEREDKPKNYRRRSREEYLNYELFILGETKKEDDTKNYTNQVLVCINQLYLKNVILKREKITLSNQILPYFESLKDLIFVHQQMALYIDENQKLSFLDLEMPKNKTILSEKLNNMGLDWYEIQENCKKRYGKKYKDENMSIDEKLKNNYFILGHQKAMEIETLDERLLPEIAEIDARMRKKKEVKMSREDFYLGMDFIQGKIELFQEENIIEKFNQLVDDVFDKEGKDKMTYDKFMSKDVMAKIKDILKIAKNTKLLEYYGMKSEKGNDVITIYSDIHYNENEYIVGDKDGFQHTQNRAHKIRKLNMTGDFKAIDILKLMAVDFIRFRQYTVYPYPFGLVKLYRMLIQ